MSDTDLRRELRELRERLDDWPAVNQDNEGPFPSTRIIKDPPKKDYKLKPGKIPTYSGNRATYAAWRKAVLSTLKIDWNTFNYDDSYVFLMIYNALEGKAQREAAAFFESGGRDGRQDPEDFIGFLDRSNWDVNKINRARGELSNLRMGKNQKWSSFFAQWANKLTEASGDQWPDDVKISQLKGKLNLNLRRALANNHLLPFNDYFGWLRIVGQIAQQHEELEGDSLGFEDFKFRGRNNQKLSSIDDFEDKQKNSSTKEWSKSGREQGFVGDLDSSGDTFMGGVNSARVLRGPNGKRLRSKWKSPEQISKLRSEGKCFRCERKGCNTNICRLLPAKRPEKKRLEVNVNEYCNLDPSLYEEEEDDDDEDRPMLETRSEN